MGTAKLISDVAVMSKILTLKIIQGTKFGTFIKPMFSMLDVIIFFIQWYSKTKYTYLGHDFQ